MRIGRYGYNARRRVVETVASLAHDGKPTFYAYDAKGRETERATYPASYASASTRPAPNLAESVTSTQWRATWKLPLQVPEPNKYREYAYDAKGNVTLDSAVDTTDATGAQKFAATRTDSTRAKTYWTDNTSSLPTTVRQTTGGDSSGVGATETGRRRLALALRALGRRASGLRAERRPALRMQFR